MAAPIKHPNAKTFTNPVTHAVTQIRTPAKAPVKKKVVLPPKVNPIDTAVNATIGGQVDPYKNMLADRGTQYTHDLADTQAVQGSMQDQLLGIQKTLATANNDALGLAAQRGTSSADQMSRNMDFLKGVLGNYVTDGGASIAAAASPVDIGEGASAAANAEAIRMGGLSSNNQLAAQRGAGVLAGGERSAQLLTQRLADQQSIQREIARIKGTAPALRYKYQQDATDRAMAAKELNANISNQKASLAEQARQADNQTALGYYNTDASTAASLASTADKNASGFKFGIDAKYDPLLTDLYKSVVNPTVADPADPTKTVGNPARRWQNLIRTMTGMGLSSGQAVLLATKWVPERLNVHGAQSPQVIYKMLKSGELGGKFSDAYAKRVFQLAGLDWSQRIKKPMQGPPAPASTKPHDKPKPTGTHGGVGMGFVNLPFGL